MIKKGNIKNEAALFGLLSKSLSLTETTAEIYTQQTVKGFDNKSFFIIKPNQFKAWHPAIAHLDVLEFDKAILKQEVERKKEAVGGAIDK